MPITVILKYFKQQNSDEKPMLKKHTKTREGISQLLQYYKKEKKEQQV